MVEASGDTIVEEREGIMGRITKKLTAAVMAAALLFSGCGKEAQAFQKVEDMMLFGSSPKEAGELLGADFSEAELVPSEDSEIWRSISFPVRGRSGNGRRRLRCIS